jgi:hypothetical protein
MVIAGVEPHQLAPTMGTTRSGSMDLLAPLPIIIDLPAKVVRIPIQVQESYDFMTLQHHVDPNPTMNPNLIESMLSPDPNHRILYNIAKSQSCLWTLPILND